MTDIGMNLAGVTYWSTEEPFIDRIHTAKGWGATDASGKDISSSLVFDQHGDVTNLTAGSKLTIGVEMDPPSATKTDEYVMTYEGTGTVWMSATAKIMSQSDGKVVFEYNGKDTAPWVQISFSRLNADDPIHDVHVVRADQVDLFNAGEIFNPDFVAKASQWSVVRFMDWGSTNSFRDVTGSNHATADNVFWSAQAHADGVPIEVMVKLANEAHVDMWYNVPTKADDEYVANALTYIRDHLDPSLKVHVEWSNEVWNTGFAQSKYAQSQADSLWGNGGTVSHGTNIYYGYRSAQIADIAHRIFSGSHAAQLYDVLAGQNGNASAMTDWQNGVAKAGFGTVSSLFKEYAVAPYFGSEMGSGVAKADLATILQWAKEGDAGLDAAFHELEFGGALATDHSLANAGQRLALAGKIADANGLDLVAYEGGISLSTTRWAAADKPVVQDFFNRLMADPRMGDLYAKEIAAFTSAGGTMFNFYNDTGMPGDSGSWGALSSIYDESSPRYDAMLAASSKTGWTGGLADNGSTDTLGDIGLDTTPSGAASDTPPIATSGHILGTAGADHLVASDENDTIDGAGGDDVVTGSSSTTDALGHLIEEDVYMGGAGADTISGGDGNDHIYGNELTTVAGSVDGADSLSGGAGNDYLQGNAGADTIDGSIGNDRIYGGADNDSLMGNVGNDYLQGNRGLDTLSGGDGNDTVHGGADNDMVRGDAGRDQLFGDAGNDTLVGGTGTDVLTGGAGNDTFVFSAQDAAFATAGAGAWATDEIVDFSHALDKIVFDFHANQVLQSAASSVSAAYDSASSALLAHHGDADVAAVTVGNDTYLFWDASGHGGAIDSAVKVDHVHDTFTLADFG